MRSRLLWQHGWKLFLFPLFFDVPIGVKYLCLAIILASLIVDLALDVPEHRLREGTAAAFSVGAVINLVSEVAGVDGWAWDLIRVASVLVFFATLFAWLALIVSKRLVGGRVR